jgi:hypothetical protein
MRSETPRDSRGVPIWHGPRLVDLFLPLMNETKQLARTTERWIRDRFALKARVENTEV